MNFHTKAFIPLLLGLASLATVHGSLPSTTPTAETLHSRTPFDACHLSITRTDPFTDSSIIGLTPFLNVWGYLSATYRYDPYGRTIAQAGPMAQTNRYRFSSKEYHEPSGLYYYGYRFYSPELQRWLNRDPLGKEEDIPLLISKHNLFGGIVAIGDNWIRAKVVDKVLNNFPDFNFIKAIHPSASLSGNVSVGIGSVVMGGAVINSNTTIGEHCIVNTNSSIDHDCKMEVFSSLAPGVTTGGNVYIGEYSAISLGAKIIHNVVIGKHTVVGAGSTVLKNLPDNCVAYNTPAKIVRNRIAGEKYL